MIVMDAWARSRGRRALFALLTAGLAVPAVTATAQSTVPASLPPEQVNWHGDPQAPDVSGVWVRVDTPATTGSKEGWRPWSPPLKGAFAGIWKKRVADAAAGKRRDDPISTCLPPGMPRFITGTNGPMLIVQTPGRVMLYRDGIPVRRVWLTPAALPAPADLEDFSNGNAIGHYEGADLVTQVIGIKDEPIDSTGVPHSDALKVVERFHRVDARTLTVMVTLIDPKAYSAPMTTTVTYRMLDDPRWEPHEFLCKPGTDYHPDRYVQ